MIRDIAKCDFRPIYEWAQKEREAKKLKAKDPKVRKAAKEEKDKLTNIYGFALVDGAREKVGNYRVEPPGLFRGRGAHPKTGMIKVCVCACETRAVCKQSCDAHRSIACGRRT